MRFFFTCAFPRVARKSYISPDAKENSKWPDLSSAQYEGTFYLCNDRVQRVCVDGFGERASVRLASAGRKALLRNAENPTRDAYAPQYPRCEWIGRSYKTISTARYERPANPLGAASGGRSHNVV
jgi:hypothetical protein